MLQRLSSSQDLRTTSIIKFVTFLSWRHLVGEVPLISELGLRLAMYRKARMQNRRRSRRKGDDIRSSVAQFLGFYAASPEGAGRRGKAIKAPIACVL